VNTPSQQRYFFELSYDGSSFFGWQKQPDKDSVQQAIETALSRLYSNNKISIVGCGRTDTGVHAKRYIFHVDLPPIDNTQQLCYKLNKMLPQSIVVKKGWTVANEMHARYSATLRTYRYFIHFEKNPFLYHYSTYFPHALTIENMNRAAHHLIGTHDFTTFSKVNSDTKTPFCTVTFAKWFVENRKQKNTCYFEYSANRFLRNMVRATVGTLLDVGQNKLSSDNFLDILRSCDRNKCSASAPAQGLLLWDVEY